MAASKKVDHFLAVRIEDELPARAWDMLRYDRCYPITTYHGWQIFRQPYIDGLKGGFTIARWESFGFKAIVDSAPVGAVTPYRFHAAIEDANLRKAGIR